MPDHARRFAITIGDEPLHRTAAAVLRARDVAESDHLWLSGLSATRENLDAAIDRARERLSDDPTSSLVLSHGGWGYLERAEHCWELGSETGASTRYPTEVLAARLAKHFSRARLVVIDDCTHRLSEMFLKMERAREAIEGLELPSANRSRLLMSLAHDFEFSVQLALERATRTATSLLGRLSPAVVFCSAGCAELSPVSTGSGATALFERALAEPRASFRELEAGLRTQGHRLSCLVANPPALADQIAFT